MALKVLMLRKKLEPLTERMAALNQTRDAFPAREAELMQDVEAAATDEERSVVEEAVEAFTRDQEANAADIARLQGEIDAINEQIRSAEAAQAAPPAAPPAAAAPKNERSVFPMPIMNAEARWFGLTYAERDAMVQNEEVRSFLSSIRSFREQSQTRAVTGATLGIPTVMLGILRTSTTRNSKLISRVTVRQVKGSARMNMAGVAPEAVWTEMTGKINELTLSITQIEIDGYKVAGYIAIPNSYLEDDDDLSLMDYIVDSLGQSIGYALDKAIVYGTGTKMPVGFVTRLAAASSPAWWGSHQGAFTPLNTTNVLTMDLASKNGTGFFQPLIGALAVADPKYSNSQLTWVMNRKTHMDLIGRGLAFNSAALLMPGMQNSMPIIGGEIIELDFMSDYDIAGGYLGLQVMVERAGTKIQASDLPLFLDDQTVVKATARWDGKPAVGEGFVIVNYNNVAPTTSKTFAPDTANTTSD